MDEIKPFSEDISTGSEIEEFGLGKQIAGIGYEKYEKELAEHLAKEAARRMGIKASAKFLVKWGIKFLPWIAGGTLLVGLVDKAVKLMKAEKIDEEAESNTIPQGEFYHKDKGWY